MTHLNAVEPQPAKQDPHADRRAFVRHPCELDSNCHPLSGSGQEWAGQVENLSRGVTTRVVFSAMAYYSKSPPSAP